MMMNADPWTDRLSAYVDGELDAEAVAELERHLEDCPACSDVVADLRAIVATAPSYDGRMPGRDLWPAIAERIDHTRAVGFPSQVSPGGRSLPSRWIGRVAAAIGLIGIGAGAAWVALEGPRAFGDSEPAPVTIVANEPDRAMLATIAYQRAMDDFQRVITEGRDRLDPETIAVVEKNLELIDRAIAESEAALAANPANLEMRTWISAFMRRKLDLLRRTAAAVGGDVTAS
jgi:anti-sigma factor RsiW